MALRELLGTTGAVSTNRISEGTAANHTGSGRVAPCLAVTSCEVRVSGRIPGRWRSCQFSCRSKGSIP